MNLRLFRPVVAVSIVFFIANAGVLAQDRAYISYIEKYKNAAIDQMRKYGIPASITLAQGLLESDAGRSILAVEGNNHFGIKCNDDWKGRTLHHDDDRRNECFRRYSSVKESFEDHSVFLTTHPRYAFLFDLDQTDYKRWARGLKKAGYATSSSYSEKLIGLIEKYRLYQYDKSAGRRTEIKVFSHQPLISNGLLYVRLAEGETLKDISKEFNISRAALRRNNEIDRHYSPEPGSVIYLEKKRRKAAKEYRVHVVRAGESLWSIAQLYGVRMNVLINRNNLSTENPLADGMTIRVR